MLPRKRNSAFPLHFCRAKKYFALLLTVINSLRTALFWVITQGVVVISYRRFADTILLRHLHRPHSSIYKLLFGATCFILDSWSLRMGPIGCPETSVRNYHYSLRNNPGERSSQLLRGGSMESQSIEYCECLYSCLSYSACKSHLLCVTLYCHL